VLALYRRHFGTLPVRVSGIELPLDAVAAWSANKRELTVAVVNPTREERALGLELRGARLLGPTRRYVITASDPRAHNAPGEPRMVDIQETSLDQAPPALPLPGSRYHSTCCKRTQRLAPKLLTLQVLQKRG
jgi:alpha-N-arabinofuranosidase